MITGFRGSPVFIRPCLMTLKIAVVVGGKALECAGTVTGIELW